MRSFLDPEKYLGLPMVIGCKKRIIFLVIINRIRGKISEWCNSQLYYVIFLIAKDLL